VECGRDSSRMVVQMLLWCCVILRALGTRSRPVLVCALICLATPEQSKATAVVDGPSVMSILRMEGCRKDSLKKHRCKLRVGILFITTMPASTVLVQQLETCRKVRQCYAQPQT